jgi:plasmid stabilization system protein ParE
VKVIYTGALVEALTAVEERLEDPVAAASLIERILDRADGLADFPRKGRKVPELDNDCWRELIEGNYRVVYTLAGEAIYIVTVIEGHRLFRLDDLDY